MSPPRIAFMLVATLAMQADDVSARTVRSTKVKNEFVRQQACPSTALNKLPCPGFVIDDKISLDCGGQDVVENKQWLTVEAGKAKDRWERNGPECKHQTHGTVPTGLGLK